MIITHWKLKADIIPQHVAADGTVFSNVVQTVHWQCFATSGSAQARAYGSVVLAMPENPASYIDLNDLTGADEAARRATVLGWAEMVWPGFVTATAARVAAKLTAEMAEPTIQTQTIL